MATHIAPDSHLSQNLKKEWQHIILVTFWLCCTFFLLHGQQLTKSQKSRATDHGPRLNGPLQSWHWVIATRTVCTLSKPKDLLANSCKTFVQDRQRQGERERGRERERERKRETEGEQEEEKEERERRRRKGRRGLEEERVREKVRNIDRQIKTELQKGKETEVEEINIQCPTRIVRQVFLI